MRFSVAFMLLVCSAALVHCGGSDVAAPKPARKSSNKPVKSTDVGTAAVEPLFSYSSIGKRDPFRSYLTELVEMGSQQKPQRKIEETEQYEMDQYRLTALVTGTSQPKAMVEDPTGRGHVLRLGSRLGKSGGRVTQINSVGMTILEETRDPLGKRVSLPIVIKLPKSEGEDLPK